jgi:hypothetical protein
MIRTIAILTIRNSCTVSPSSRGGAGAGGGEPRLCRDGGGAEEGAASSSHLGRAAAQDVRPGCVRVLEVWRQAADLGVREGREGSASDTGAPGLAHGRCELGPCARVNPGRVVLRLTPPQSQKAQSPTAHPMGGRLGRSCTSRGYAACPPAWLTAGAAPVSAPPRHLHSSPHPQHSLYPAFCEAAPRVKHLRSSSLSSCGNSCPLTSAGTSARAARRWPRRHGVAGA